MKNLPVVSLLLFMFSLSACSISGVASAPGDEMSRDVAVFLSPDEPRETVLLVSLDDGSVIMQTISSSADMCFKKASDSSTTCLSQGSPVIDPHTNAVIGFEMIEEHIDLVAKTD